MKGNRPMRMLVFAVFVLASITTPPLVNSQTCSNCIVPTSETTYILGTGTYYGGSSVMTSFDQIVSNGSYSFDGRTMEEQSGGPGDNTCYWTGSGMLQNPTVTGGVWTVGSGDGYCPASHNHWGCDRVGYVDPAMITYIRTNAPMHDVPLPCTASMYQVIVIWCNDSLNWAVKSNLLTVTVDTTTVSNCRAGLCAMFTAP